MDRAGVLIAASNGSTVQVDLITGLQVPMIGSYSLDAIISSEATYIATYLGKDYRALVNKYGDGMQYDYIRGAYKITVQKLPSVIPEWYAVTVVNSENLLSSLDLYTQISFTVLILGMSLMMYIYGNISGPSDGDVETDSWTAKEKEKNKNPLLLREVVNGIAEETVARIAAGFERDIADGGLKHDIPKKLDDIQKEFLSSL